MRRRHAVGLALSLTLAVAPDAWAGADLRGIAPAGRAGSDTAALAAVGDVNGDGVQDVGVGLQGDLRTPKVASLSDIAVVAFGPTTPDPSRPGFSGLVVSHLDEPRLFDDGFGQAVAGNVVGVGDWDGDGLADVAFGAVGAGPNQRPNAGSVYVVLGRRDPGAVDLRSDPGVIRIDGPARSSQIGRTIGAVGDVDGDGRPDLAIALAGERAVVVRGGLAAGTTIDLASPPAGTTIQWGGLDGGTPDPAFGERGAEPEAASFAPVGDLDGDGRGEVLVGVPAADALRGRGRAFVVRGAAAGAVVDAADPGQRLARLVAPKGVPGFGGTVAAIPDTDGDGRPEWGVGVWAPDGLVQLGGNGPSGAYVIFSTARGEVRPGTAGQPAVTVDARLRGAHAGRSLAGVPDATGDGVPDLVLGLPDVSPACRAGAGAIALVPGRRTPGRVAVGARTPRIDGARAGGELGERLAPAGGDLFFGVRPFENSAQLDLWRLPMTTFASPSPVLPALDDCLSVTIAKSSRAQVRRTGAVRVTVHSNAGDGRAHRLKVSLYTLAGRTYAGGRSQEVSLRSTGTVRVTLRLPRRAAALLAGDREIHLSVTAQQRIGSGPYVTSGAYAGDSLRLR
jgi:hypothetical protein